jgi:prepilin-type N-terminal cleavage/methylation domain-containing protein
VILIFNPQITQITQITLRARSSKGFTLIELLVVMIIAGAAIGLVAPRLISAYEGIKAAAEEQKLTDIVETVKMRSFLRQVPYTIEFEGNALKVRNEDVGLRFEFISFPPATIMFNGNGFADSDTLRYIIRGVEKVLDVL